HILIETLESGREALAHGAREPDFGQAEHSGPGHELPSPRECVKRLAGLGLRLVKVEEEVSAIEDRADALGSLAFTGFRGLVEGEDAVEVLFDEAHVLLNGVDVAEEQSHMRFLASVFELTLQTEERG